MKLWGRREYGNRSGGDGEGMGQRPWGWGGDWYGVYLDGREWGSFSVPVQNSRL